MSEPDLFARCSRAWRDTFYGHERRGLCTFAGVDPEACASLAWSELPEPVREKLLFAMRQAVALGDECRKLIA